MTPAWVPSLTHSSLISFLKMQLTETVIRDSHPEKIREHDPQNQPFDFEFLTCQSVFV